MSPENNHSFPPDFDQSRYTLMSNLWLFQGSHWEAMIHQDVFTAATQSVEPEQPNCGGLIWVEIMASLILIGVNLLIHWTSSPVSVSAPTDSQEVQLQPKFLDNGS